MRVLRSVWGIEGDGFGIIMYWLVKLGVLMLFWGLEKVGNEESGLIMAQVDEL